MLNKRRLIKLTQRLIQINSENPISDESSLAKEVKKQLKSIGLKSKIYNFHHKRSNVISVWKGKGRYRLLLSPHLDTVPAGGGWRFPPLAGKLFKGKIYGRGATDCKGNLAVALEVLRSLKEDGFLPYYNIVLAATADEEMGSKYGLIPLLNKGILNVDFAIILDGDSSEIIITQKGLIHAKVIIWGKKAHGAYPWRGINAIQIASEIISSFKGYKFSFKPQRLLHKPTINIGTIRGGDKVNIVADWCEFELDIRFLPGMQKEQILTKLKDFIRRKTRRFCLQLQSVQLPYSINKDHPLIKVLASSVKEIKHRVKFKGSEGATTITFFQEKRIPAVAIGFGTKGQAHTTDESVKVEDLYQGAKILEIFLKKLNEYIKSNRY